MCRTVHAVLSTAICGVQMLVRVFMTIILMIENLIRMLLQTLYNFISFMLQMISLIPICVVFLVTARLKCFMCGGGGPCPVNRGGACDCLMSAAALIILFFIFRATGVLDKIFYKIGYVQAPPVAVVRFVPTPGDVTECSRNDSNIDSTTTTPVASSTKLFLRYMDYTMETETETEELKTPTQLPTALRTNATAIRPVTKKLNMRLSSKRNIVAPYRQITKIVSTTPSNQKARKTENPLEVATAQKMDTTLRFFRDPNNISDNYLLSTIPHNLTTVLYYLV